MSAQAEVAPPDLAPGELRVRPPSPLPPRRRAVLIVLVVLLVAAGAALVLAARSADGDEVPDAAWRGTPVPRAAKVDAFDGAGRLGEVDGFGTWQPFGGGWVVDDGEARSTTVDQTGALVDAGSPNVLVHARFEAVTAGGGVLVSADLATKQAIVLSAGEGDRTWELRQSTTAGGEGALLATYTAPHERVAVQVIRRGDKVKVSFDGKAYDVTLRPGAPTGTAVGVGATHPGTVLDLFGYLPLPAG